MIEVVTSCWRYSKLLTFHLSHYLLYPPRIPTTVTVWFAEEDPETIEVLNWFGDIDAPNIAWQWRTLPIRNLMRRGISRNLSLKHTTAKVVVMTDVDYLYSGETLQAIFDEVTRRELPKLYYTPNVLGNVDESYGDQEIARVKGPAIMDVEQEYVPRPLKTAIGGSQIVPGSWARANGYIPRSKLLEPSDTWQRTTEDPEFRKTCGLALHRIEAAHPLRIRHNPKGRDGEFPG